MVCYTENKSTEIELISEERKDLDRVATPPVEEAREAPETLPNFKLQPDPESSNAGSCSVDELLRYHDRSFVRNAYEVVLRRSPTAGELDRALGELRNGQRSKLEIIEALVASQGAGDPRVVVTGLPSPTLRKISKWPVIGYFVRVVRAVTRLPKMMQDQQRFESYAIAQQERLADFLNHEILPAVNLPHGPQPVGELRTMVEDAVETVIMLSESIIEFAGKQPGFEENLIHCEEQLKQITTQLSSLELAQRELQSHVEKLSQEPSQLHAQIVTLQEQHDHAESQLHQDIARVSETLRVLQEQRENSEKVLHQDLARVTETLTEMQSQFEELNTQSVSNSAAQREFLIQEQRSIVETQKVAIKELEILLTDTQQETAEKLRSLSDIVSRLEAAATDNKPNRSTGEESEKL